MSRRCPSLARVAARRMSHTPRQAALLAQLFAPDPGVRTAAILAHVADPVAAASAGLGPFVRAKLADPDLAARLTAADYLWRVSGDPAPAAVELCDRFRRRDASDIADGLSEAVRRLDPEGERL